MEKIPVKDIENLVRDSKNGAISNTDRKEFLAFVQRREEKLKEKSRIETLENDVSEIKDTLGKILDLLKGK